MTASLLDEALQATSGLNAVFTAMSGRQAHHLDVPGTLSAAALSVVAFEATEKMGAPTAVRIVLTHPQQLPRTDYLNLDATFRIAAEDGSQRKFSGYIERFSTIQTTKDFTKYEIVLKSHFGRLQAVKNTQPYQHLTTPQIIQTIVRRHGIQEHQVSFRLRGRYPVHLWRFQHQMTDFDYVHMLMEKAGIYCYIVETEYGDQVVFADDIDHYIYDPQLIVPYREAAGLEAAGVEAVSALKTHTVTVPQSFLVADYNPESAWERFRDQANVAPQDPTTYGRRTSTAQPIWTRWGRSGRRNCVTRRPSPRKLSTRVRATSSRCNAHECSKRTLCCPMPPRARWWSRSLTAGRATSRIPTATRPFRPKGASGSGSSRKTGLAFLEH